MYSIEITKQAVIYLKNKLEPKFIYFVYPHFAGDLFDVLYYSDKQMSEYETAQTEIELKRICGNETVLTNLKYTDMDFAQDMVGEGEVVYCRDDKALHEYLGSLYMDFENMLLDRQLLIGRMAECGSVFLQ